MPFFFLSFLSIILILFYTFQFMKWKWAMPRWCPLKHSKSCSRPVLCYVVPLGRWQSGEVCLVDAEVTVQGESNMMRTKVWLLCSLLEHSMPVNRTSRISVNSLHRPSPLNTAHFTWKVELAVVGRGICLSAQGSGSAHSQMNPRQEETMKYYQRLS